MVGMGYLPPPGASSLEGQVIVVQEADILQSLRIIPDLATWSQCFILYVAALAPHQPARLLDLMACQLLIASKQELSRSKVASVGHRHEHGRS